MRCSAGRPSEALEAEFVEDIEELMEEDVDGDEADASMSVDEGLQQLAEDSDDDDQDQESSSGVGEGRIAAIA